MPAIPMAPGARQWVPTWSPSIPRNIGAATVSAIRQDLKVIPSQVAVDVTVI